jgi:ATP-dependent Lhr-like helicase
MSPESGAIAVSPAAAKVLETLRRRGASFLDELAQAAGVGEDDARRLLAELVAAGLVSSDGFAGLRSIAGPPGRSSRMSRDRAGRWSALSSSEASESTVEVQARALLRRYGVVARKLLTRESIATTWYALLRVYRRLELGGEVRGGRFVSGLSGEQFALPEAVRMLREVRRTPPSRQLVVISAADPLNLCGIVTPGERLRAVASTRIACRDGLALAVLEGDYARPLAEVDSAETGAIATALAGRPVPPVISGFVGRLG